MLKPTFYSHNILNCSFTSIKYIVYPLKDNMLMEIITLYPEKHKKRKSIAQT